MSADPDQTAEPQTAEHPAAPTSTAEIGAVAAAERDLDWPECHNVRDVGGLPTMDGHCIKHGALIRADSLNRLTVQGIAAVNAAGVSRIIDLRRQTEQGVAAHPFKADPRYVNIPVQDPADPDHQWMPLDGIYATMLDLRPDLFGAAMAAVADAPPGAVVVHCAGGKDRTGMMTAMALSVAGVADDVIAADYALSEKRLREQSAAYVTTLTDARLREIVLRLQPTPPSIMLRTLAHLQATYGGVGAYLRTAGLPDAQLHQLGDRLREG